MSCPWRCALNKRQSLKIGPLSIDPPLALAPMAGITNHAFRVLAAEKGCSLFYSEMISARGLLYNNLRTDSLLHFTEADRPFAVQLFGCNPDNLARAAELAAARGVDLIDLNLGCPMRKITGNGEGGALLRDPALCSKIFKTVSGAVDCPVTAKIRIGWDENSINAVEIAAAAEEAGLAAIAVHGRTVAQGYSGKANWLEIRKVKDNVTIPVIGNGDVVSAQSAGEMFSYTGCDGIMVGRAARGNPWIFTEISAFLEGKDLPEKPGLDEMTRTLLRHFTLLIELKGEYAASREMRRHSGWYIKGLPGAAALRDRLIRASGYKETEKILHHLKEH